MDADAIGQRADQIENAALGLKNVALDLFGDAEYAGWVDSADYRQADAIIQLAESRLSELAMTIRARSSTLT